MLSNKEKDMIVGIFVETDEADQKAVIKELAKEFETLEMEIRQVLQDRKVYKDKLGKTEKQQYAYALACVTGIKESEFMKLTAASQKKLMGVFRGE